jgi:transposase-like protein
MKATPETITSAMQLYFSGESLRNTQKFLKLRGVIATHVTVYRWIQKYVRLMEKYLDAITPQVGDTWRADELYLKVKGDTKYLFALMDDETRFLIAQQVANTKYTSDIRPLFAKGKAIAEKQPKVLITDGAHNFHDAYMREFWTIKYGKTKHIKDIRMGDVPHNNKMERLNGEIRDREKVMRSLKKPDTPILTGYQIYHNYVRPHMALKGKTPADLAGIQVKGVDKWLTIIQNASKRTKRGQPGS